MSKLDIVISELMVPISIFLGGLALYMTLALSWFFAPFIVVALMIYGFSCIGIERTKQIKS